MLVGGVKGLVCCLFTEQGLCLNVLRYGICDLVSSVSRLEGFRKPILITCPTGLKPLGHPKLTAFPAASFLQSCCRLLNIRVVGALYYFRKTRELEITTSASPNARASTFDYHRFKNWLK